VVQQGGLAGRLGAEDGDQVVVEAGLGDAVLGEVLIEMRATEEKLVSNADFPGIRARRADGVLTNLKALSSSMTWIPCS